MMQRKTANRFAKFVFPALAVACLVTSAGCISGSSRYSFAFSPDGKKVAYSSPGASQLLLYDFDTSQYKILPGPEEEYYGAVFWPEEKGELVLITANYISICEKAKTFLLKVIRINPDSGETRTVFQKQLSCELEEWSNLPGLFPNFDDKAAVLIINENIFSLNEKPTPTAKALTKLVKRFLVLKKRRDRDYVEVPYAFNFSPDRRFLYFMMYKYDASTNDGDNELFIFGLGDGKVWKIPRKFNSYNDLSGEQEPTDLAKWDPAGEAIYYPGVIRGREGLIRYNMSTSGETLVFNQSDIFAFDPFPSGDRILVIYNRNESKFVSIIKADGTILKTFPFWEEENTSCSMSDNAIKVSNDGLYAVYPYCGALVLFDLANQRDEIFAYSEDDHAWAGVIYSRANRYEKAIPHFEKAGEAGLPGLYLTYYIMRRNDEANAIYEKMMNTYAQGNKDPHYILVDKLEKSFSSMEFSSDLRREEFLKVTGPEQGMAFFHIGSSEMMNNGDENIQLLEKAISIFREQGCYEEPPSHQCVSDMEMVDNAPFKLGWLYQRDKRQPEYFLNEKKDYPRTYKKHFEEIHSYLLAFFTRSDMCKEALVQTNILLDYYRGQPRTWQIENAEKIQKTRRDATKLKKKCSKKK